MKDSLLSSDWYSRDVDAAIATGQLVGNRNVCGLPGIMKYINEKLSDKCIIIQRSENVLKSEAFLDDFPRPDLAQM